MVGPSPAEDAARELARQRNDARLTWSQNVRAALRVFETHPDLPYPRIDETAIVFLLGGYGLTARLQLAAAEMALAGALGVTFTGALSEFGGGGLYYDLTARLRGGLPLIIRTVASEVAEEKVVRQEVTDVTEWVRRPVEDESEES